MYRCIHVLWVYLDAVCVRGDFQPGGGVGAPAGGTVARGGRGGGVGDVRADEPLVPDCQ